MLNLINVTLTRMALISDAVGLRCANPSYETTVFLIKSKGQHPQLVNEANTGSLTLLPVVLLLQNLQQSIARILLCGATGMNG